MFLVQAHHLGRRSAARHRLGAKVLNWSTPRTSVARPRRRAGARRSGCSGSRSRSAGRRTGSAASRGPAARGAATSRRARRSSRTASRSSTSTSISWPRDSRLLSAKVSRWASWSSGAVPGITSIAPFAALLARERHPRGDDVRLAQAPVGRVLVPRHEGGVARFLDEEVGGPARGGRGRRGPRPRRGCRLVATRSASHVNSRCDLWRSSPRKRAAGPARRPRARREPPARPRRSTPGPG